MNRTAPGRMVPSAPAVALWILILVGCAAGCQPQEDMLDYRSLWQQSGVGPDVLDVAVVESGRRECAGYAEMQEAVRKADFAASFMLKYSLPMSEEHAWWIVCYVEREGAAAVYYNDPRPLFHNTHVPYIPDAPRRDAPIVRRAVTARPVELQRLVTTSLGEGDSVEFFWNFAVENPAPLLLVSCKDGDSVQRSAGFYPGYIQEAVGWRKESDEPEGWESRVALVKCLIEQWKAAVKADGGPLDEQYVLGNLKSALTVGDMPVALPEQLSITDGIISRSNALQRYFKYHRIGWRHGLMNLVEIYSDEKRDQSWPVLEAGREPLDKLASVQGYDFATTMFERLVSSEGSEKAIAAAEKAITGE